MVLKNPTIQTHTRIYMCVCDEIASWRRLELMRWNTDECNYCLLLRCVDFLSYRISFFSLLFWFGCCYWSWNVFKWTLLYAHTLEQRPKKRRALNITEKHQDIMYRNYNCSDIAVVRWIVILVCVSVSAFWWFFHPWILFFFYVLISDSVYATRAITC